LGKHTQNRHTTKTKDKREKKKMPFGKKNAQVMKDGAKSRLNKVVPRRNQGTGRQDSCHRVHKLPWYQRSESVKRDVGGEKPSARIKLVKQPSRRSGAWPTEPTGNLDNIIPPRIITEKNA